MKLEGNSLGKRQKELNTKVIEAALKNVDFEELKAQDEADDLDKLFKIDLASKYKNVNYMIDVLKCGDSLYVTRALKCSWLYDDAYSKFINPEFLHDNIFPYMSLKMKKKMLTKISIHVRDESRAASFYTYCQRDLSHFAEKFLLFTSESFKLNLIKNNINALMILMESDTYLRHFIGNSFVLAEAYVKEVVDIQSNIFHSLRYMYSVSNVKYLDIVEKYINYERILRCYKRFGLRISKDIMKNHKKRVINNLLLYIKFINENMFKKYITVIEAKQCVVKLLPQKSTSFWETDFYNTYKFITDLIPVEEKFEFLKQIFMKKYPGEPFEMSEKFYYAKYQQLMTVDEREAWALRHIESKTDFLGAGKDFKWYRFVNFDRAFPDIKKYLLVASDATKRGKVLSVLAESARNQRDLEKLFKYYYERHVNEYLNDKISFLNIGIQDHNVVDFDDDCWTAFNKLLYSMDVYNMKFYDYSIHTNYRLLALFYHVIHKIEFPEGLNLYMKDNVDFWNMKGKLGNLNEEKRMIIFEYLYKYFIEKISQYDSQPYSNDVQEKVRSDISFVLEMLEYFNKKDECPDIVKKYQRLDAYFSQPQLFEKDLCEWDILRHLKDNSGLVMDDLTVLENYINKGRKIFLNNLLKKLNTYFSNDLGQEYLQFFKKLLLSPQLGQRMACIAVHGIFQLADSSTKCDILTKYVPSDKKIDFCNIDRNDLYIQEAICRFAHYSRPPVPFSKLRSYINGDYLKYCLPMFNSYLSSLPPPLCLEFVSSLIDAPVSVQKHGLRLGFKCFSFENLKTLVIKAWKRNKNVSLRMVIYENLFEYMIKCDEEGQSEIFAVLKSMTLDLKDEDDENILKLILSFYKIPDKYRGEYLVAVWYVVSKFPWCMVRVVDGLVDNYNFVDKEFLKDIIIDHINCMLSEKQILSEDKYEISALQEAKWKLAATYFTKLNIDEENHKWILKTLKTVLHKFSQVWKEDYTVIPKTCFQFIDTLIELNFQNEKDKCINNCPIFESLLVNLENSLPVSEIYLVAWNLRVTIIAIKALREDLREDIASKFGRELCNLVRESVDSKTYNSAFFNKIVEVITNTLLNIETTIDSNTFRQDMISLVGVQFVDFEMLETQLLAVEMFSSVYSLPSTNNVKEFLRKLKNIKNNDVQCLLYQKFVDSGFCREMANILFE